MSLRNNNRRSVMAPPRAPFAAASRSKISDFSEEDSSSFVSGERFDFRRSPNMVMTRARRSSIYGGDLSGAMSGKSSRGISKGTKLGSIAEKKVPKSVIESKKMTSEPRVKIGGRTTEAKMVVRRTSRQPIKTVKAKKTPKAFSTLMLTPAAISQPKSAKKKAANKKENVTGGQTSPPPTYDEAMFRDVQVILEKLQHTPAKRIASPNLVFEELEEVRDSPKRVDIVCKSLLREAKFLDEQQKKKKEENIIKTPETFKMPSVPATSGSKKRVTRSARKVTQESSGRILASLIVPKFEILPRANPPPPPTSSTIPGTPQPVAANPSAILRHNLKTKVKVQMEEKVSQMLLPPGSPYSMMEGETEQGSPRFLFTKLSENPKTSKYLTGTPGLARKTPRVAMRSIGNCDSSKITSSMKKKVEENSGLRFDDQENSLVPNSPPFSSPVKQPQLMTGDLAKVCVVM